MLAVTVVAAVVVPATTKTGSPTGGARIMNGGYVLIDGHFRVDSAQSILDFTLGSRCAGTIALPAIPLDATGAFVFAGHPPTAPAQTTASVIGRFVSSREARGTTQVSRGTCRGETVPFVALLS